MTGNTKGRKGRVTAMDQERIETQFSFIREIDREKFIGRQTYLSDGERKENDAEHAWHMAILTVLLSEYANEKIDVLRTVTMLLIHDIVEEGKKTQKERERKAAERLYGLLPSDQGEKLKSLWEEFEACATPEARFARCMDNLQPMMLNAVTDGKAWVEHQVELSQILGRNQNTHTGSEILWEYARKNWIDPNVEKGTIKGGK